MCARTRSIVQNAEFQVHTQRGSAQLTAAALWRRNGGGGGTLRELLSGQYAASTKGAAAFAAAVQFSC